MPEDLKNYRADAFQLIEPHIAARCLLIALAAVCILEWVLAQP